MEEKKNQELPQITLKKILSDALLTLEQTEINALIEAMNKIKKYIPLSILNRHEEIKNILYNPEDEYLVVETALLKITIADELYDDALVSTATSYVTKTIAYLEEKCEESNVYKILYDENGVETYNNDELMRLLVWLANNNNMYNTVLKHKK